MSTDSVVLVEGRSDAAALDVLFRSAGLTSRVEIIMMDGVTNFRRVWTATRAAHESEAIAVLCDGGEIGFVTRPLIATGEHAEVFVCDSDLEDELIRALGPVRARDAVAAAGLGSAFEILTRQPQWQGRPLDDQLHRFAGAGAGRKEVLAAAWTEALSPQDVPPPLAGLIAWARRRTR